MKLEKEFYLYTDDGKKVINVTYCRDCGDRYFFRGLAKTIYEPMNEKFTQKQILDYKARHNLMFEKELGDQMTLESFLGRWKEWLNENKIYR